MQADHLTHRSGGAGYLGSTSFAATFRDDRFPDLNNILQVKYDSDEHWQECLSYAETSGRLQQGAALLELIPELLEYESLLKIWIGKSNGFTPESWLTTCVSSLRASIYEPLLELHEDQRRHFLTERSGSIFRETWRPLIFDSTYSAEQFARLFTDQHLRWEAVGLFFSWVGLVNELFGQITTKVPGFDRLQFQPGLSRKMLQAADLCISFCEESGHLTDLELCLRGDNFQLCSLTEGDAGNVTWQKLGSMTSACVAKGLHAEISVSSVIPFWLAERRKTIFSNVYNLDKHISTFLGRPATLSRRFCIMQLPLDLSEEDLDLPQSLLEEKVERLDDQGWNTENNVYTTSFIRACLIGSMLKDDISEFSLGTTPAYDAALAREIQGRIESAWDSLPPFIQTPPKTGTAGESDLLPWLGLDFMDNRFLMRRAIFKKLDASQHSYNDLLAASSTQLAYVLDLTNSLQGRLGTDVRTARILLNLPWLLAKHALPPAGMLALALLRQAEPHYPPPHTSWPTPSSLNKSETVQTLSVLASTLAWAVKPGHGNFRICDHARRVVLLILDRVLGAPTARPTSMPMPAPSLAPRGDAGGETAADVVVPWWWDSEVDFWSKLPEHPLLQ